MKVDATNDNVRWHKVRPARGKGTMRVQTKEQSGVMTARQGAVAEGAFEAGDLRT